MISVKSRRRCRAQDRRMGSMLIGFVVGLTIGAASGSELGAFAGAVLGMGVGIAVYGARWLQAHLGDSPVTVHHRVMCTPLGHQADCEMVGDIGQGRWYDVRSCSLLPVANEVRCDKGCVRLLNLSGVRPGEPCRCASREDAAA
jgi:hypothetical protein